MVDQSLVMSARDASASSVGSGGVLHVAWSLVIGGAERALYQLVIAQQASGMDVGVLVAAERGLYGERLVKAGVPVTCLRQLRSVDFVAATKAHKIFGQWDVVHFHAAEPALMLSSAFGGAARFYTHRAGAFRYPFRRRLRYHAAGAIMRHRFDGVAGNTAHAADVATRLFGIPRSRVAVIYNGIDWDLLKPDRNPDDVREELCLPNGAFVLGTTGNLRDWKRLDIALRAIGRSRDGAVLVIVGDGPEKKSLEVLTRSLGVEDRVRFTGRRANVADYLQIFDAFVLPSGQEESFGNSAVEAMGFGLPTIVMYDGGGLVEHVMHEETGIVAMGVDDMSSWIDCIASDSSLARSLGARGREHVRCTYTIEHVVEGHAALYADAGRRKSGGS